jgi:hypothetical protein
MLNALDIETSKLSGKCTPKNTNKLKKKKKIPTEKRAK